MACAVVFHDESLQRVTDRVGRIRDLPFTEVKKAHIGNAERIHSLQEVLEHFPRTRFNIDIKEDNAVDPVMRVLSRSDHLDRVCVASFSWRRLRTVRARFGEAVCTSLAPQEVTALVSRSRLGPLSAGSRFVLPTGPTCVQVPARASGLRIVTPSLLRQAEQRGWPVHVWTVNEPSRMIQLLDAGVHGIITDRPSVLRQVLDARARGNVSDLSNAPGRRAPGTP